MKPRQSLVEIFSTFLRLESDCITGWLTSQRLRRSMTDCLQEAPPNQADDRWARYWHRRWEQHAHPLAEAHLTAHLQETCYWVARKMALGFADRTAIADFFQIAIARVPNLLKHFNARYSQSFKSYAELVFKNSLKDWLRVQQQVEVCTDWALLYRLSRKRLLEALQWAALQQSTIEQYVLAWECFRELVAVDDSRMNALKGPDTQTWQAIAEAYNAERSSQLSLATAASPALLKQWLLKCASTVREFLNPGVISVDAPKLGQDVTSILDSLGDDLKHAPMEILIAQEEELTRQAQLAQLIVVLTRAIETLTAEERNLLWSYYNQEWTQTQIAEQFGLEQYQVSRQLGRIRRSLLKKLAQWSQETLHISPTPEVVDAMSLTLEEWLRQTIKDKGRGSAGMNLMKPNQVYLKLPHILPIQPSVYSTAGARQRAQMNQQCLEAFLSWLQAEFNVTAKTYPSVAALPGIWEVVNGTAVTFDKIRLVLLPTIAIALDELRVPQEWVDIPSWVADYYLAMQIDPEQGWMQINGYTTHQQLKAKGMYEADDRTYTLAVDDLWQDINGLWIAQQLHAQATLREAVAPVPLLPLAQANHLLERLGNPAITFPRRAVPFQLWAALLAHGGWRQQLYERRQGVSDRGSVSQWIQTGLSGFAQQLGWQQQKFVLTVPGVRGDFVKARIARSLVIEDKPYELRVFSINRSANSTWRVELRSAMSDGTIPSGFKLRLLTEDLQGMENNEHIATTEVERLYIDVVLEPGAGFVWEIEPMPEAFDREILRF